jgi:predicted ATPase/DNA-binding winged helix-turn-helix (wHTH) protein
MDTLDSHDLATAGAAREPDPVLAFGPFTLHRARQLLMNGDAVVRLGSRAFALLVDLVEHAGQLRTRQQLEARIWPRSIVEETSLRVHMSALRRALADGRDGARYIANDPGRGYTFVASVRTLPAGGKHGAAPAPAQPARGMDRLIGRAADLDALSAQLAQHRLLTIVGPGGIGKTALALAAAGRLAHAFAEGARMLDLSTVTDPERVAQTVAELLELSLPATEPLAALCRMLEGWQVLLVLDNCEQVVDGVAALALALLQAGSGIRLLATSREPLDAEGERLYMLSGLGTPDAPVGDPELALSWPAVELFVERARATDDRFALSAVNAAAICTLCQYLDGIPLAIELAAARVDSLGIPALLDSLGDLLGLLTRPRRTARPQHRTLEAMLEWSHALLSDEERTVLRRCAVFRSGFCYAAAVAVCTGAGLDAGAVIAAVIGLAAKSLLMFNEEDGALRYRMLYLTRNYAMSKLQASGEAPALAARHARHVADVLDDMMLRIGTPEDLTWVAMFGRSTEDLRAAIDWAFSEAGDDDLGFALIAKGVNTVIPFQQLDDFVRRLERALDALQQASQRRPVLEIWLNASLILFRGHSSMGADERQRPLIERLRALIGADLSERQQAYSRYCMCSALFGLGDYRAVLALSVELTELARCAHDLPVAVVADRYASYSLHYLGEHAQARVLCERLLHVPVNRDPFHAWTPVPHAVSMRTTLARIAWIEGAPCQAARLAHEAVAFTEHQNPMAACLALGMGAIPIALWRGDDAYAARLTVRLHELAERYQLAYWFNWTRGFTRALARRDPRWADGQTGRMLAWSGAPNAMAADTMATFGPEGLEAGTLARAEEGDMGWCAPEVLRVHAVQLLRDDPGAREEADRLLERALVLARAQAALSWELRIACTRLEWWQDTPRAAGLRVALASVLACFREGAETADQLAGRALLAGGPAPATQEW